MEPVTVPDAATATKVAGAAAPRAVAPCDYAGQLREAAALLQAQRADTYRVAAYRKAADAIAKLDHAAIVDAVEHHGIDGLDRLPHVGRGIATAIVEMVRTGHWGQLERLRGSADPAHLFAVVPGLGHRLADRIYEELHVDTLEALEFAAHDGRLEHVPGVGPRRAAAIRASLHTLLVRDRGACVPAVDAGPHPSVKLLLAIDRTYRERDAAGALPTIAPIRFNPTGEAWLPILHCERDGWQFTAMFSNTAQAHQLNRTRDWVRIICYDSENSEGQHTVITEMHGALTGRRVVRGHEPECRAYYA